MPPMCQASWTSSGSFDSLGALQVPAKVHAVWAFSRPSANALLAAVAEPDLALPPPHGWIGTADDWARGLGIAFVVLALAILAVSWGRLRRAGLTPGLK